MTDLGTAWFGTASEGPFRHEEGPVLDPATCDAIVAEAERAGGWGSARVYREGGVHLDLSERCVRSQPFDVVHHATAVAAVVDQLARWNDRTFRFDLRCLPAEDEVNLLRYESGSADHFRDHADAGLGSPTRKLTFVVQLSAPEAYQGCELALTGLGHVASRDQGSMIAFPATARHAVTPIVRGVRHCLVGWVHGPTFR